MNKHTSIILTLCSLIFFSLQVQGQFNRRTVTVKGKIQFINQIEDFPKNSGYNINKMYYKHKNSSNKEILDSVEVKEDGNWEANLIIDTPTFYYFNFFKWQYITVWADSNMEIIVREYDTTKMKLKNLPYIYIKGSKKNGFINLINHANYRHFQEVVRLDKKLYFSQNPFNKQWNDFLKETKSIEYINDDFNERILLMVEVFKDNPVIIYANNFLNKKTIKNVMIPLIKKIYAANPWYYVAKNILEESEKTSLKEELLKPNMPAPKFQFTEASGNTLTLNSYKGKYLLIDFWASWCGPCRKATPALIEFYDKYKDKGFEILSVSIDDDIAAWKQAVIEEEVPWKQVRSLKKEETMETFNFSGIPTFFLIDPNGNIVEIFTGLTEEFKVKLKSIFEK